MKIVWFHLMPYRDLRVDFGKTHNSARVTLLFDYVSPRTAVSTHRWSKWKYYERTLILFSPPKRSATQALNRRCHSISSTLAVRQICVPTFSPTE